MRILFLTIIFLLNNSLSSHGQNCYASKKLLGEINSAKENKEFSKKDFYKLNSLIFDLEFKDSLKTLINCETYLSSIKTLFDSNNEYKRVFAYRLISCTSDTSFNKTLIQRINSNESSLLKTWSSTALMKNKSSEAAESLFKLFSSPPDGYPLDILIKIYIKYDTVSVKKVCWNYIDSEERNEQIISILCLANFEKSDRLQMRLKEFLEDWDDVAKGWVISAMSIQGMKNLKPLLSKYEKTENLKDVIIRALDQSPTQSDNEYAEKLKADNDIDGQLKEMLESLDKE